MRITGEYERKRLSLRKRKRELGAGRPFKLDLRNRLLMLLVYYRLYVTFALEGFLFDLDQSSIYRDVRILEPLVKECIPLPEKMYAMTRRARTAEDVEKYFPGFKAFIDATEQEIPRPENKRRRKSFYSGKKKRHTAKTQLAVNSDGLIVHKTDHARGRKHDYALYKEEHPILPKEVNQIFDLGYKGIKSDFPGLNSTLPFKRAKGQKEEKRFNRKLSRLRVVVEHTISRVKKFQIMGQEFRNRLKHYDVMTDIVSGLVNLRIIGNKAILPQEREKQCEYYPLGQQLCNRSNNEAIGGQKMSAFLSDARLFVHLIQPLSQHIPNILNMALRERLTYCEASYVYIAK